MDLKEKAILDDGVSKHRYCRAKAEALSAWMPKPGGNKMLDIGFGAMFPLAVLLRSFSRKKPTDGAGLRRAPWLINAMLHGLCRLEKHVTAANRLAGLSVCCICRRY